MKKALWVSVCGFFMTGIFSSSAPAKIPEYDSALLDCTAKWANEEITFSGRGIGWEAKSQALSSCESWARDAGLDPSACHIELCVFAFEGDAPVFTLHDALPVSVRECLDRVKKIHEQDIAINQRARQHDYQLCFRFPVGEAFDACAYDVEVTYDARVQELEAKYAAQKQSCLTP